MLKKPQTKVFDDIVGYEATFMCDICVDEKPKSAGFHITGCDHSYCSDCVAMYVTTQLEENVSTIKCPNVGCEVKLDPQHCTTILTRQVFDKWCDALCEALVESSSERFYCPFKDCSVLLINDLMAMLTESECPECHRLFCAQCRVSWHSDVSCEEYKKMDKNQIERDDKLLVKLANDNQWKRCPNCSYYVEKSSGCLFMTCRCKCTFCYQCGDEAKDHYCKNCKQLNPFT